MAGASLLKLILPNKHHQKLQQKMRLRQQLVTAVILVGLSSLGSPATATKIDDSLASALFQHGMANVIVSFSADVMQVHNRIATATSEFPTRGEKITSMKSQLESLARVNQKTAVKLLKSRNIYFDSFWINNRIHIANASKDLVEALTTLPEVVQLRLEKVTTIGQPLLPGNRASIINAAWGVEKIEAPGAWALPGGNNGTGVVVSIIDIGVRYTHEALRNNYRADYGWYDPYSGTTATPDDPLGLGTHVMGSLVGGNGIGVAPGAQWIACRGCSMSSCTEAALTACGQWIVCPTLTNGESPDCTKAPQLVVNSWGGGSGDNWYYTVVEAWHSAGIIPLFSAGNSGPSCATATSPGDMDNVIAVGATTPADAIYTFSSRGPSSSLGNRLLKPDITAPGSDIWSAWNSGDAAYNTLSGTPMALPHAAGVTALLLARNPQLGYGQIKDLLQDNVERDGLQEADPCGGIPTTTFPNHVYGYGRVNARKSLEAAFSGSKILNLAKPYR